MRIQRIPVVYDCLRNSLRVVPASDQRHNHKFYLPFHRYPFESTKAHKNLHQEFLQTSPPEVFWHLYTDHFDHVWPLTPKSLLMWMPNETIITIVIDGVFVLFLSTVQYHIRKINIHQCYGMARIWVLDGVLPKVNSLLRRYSIEHDRNIAMLSEYLSETMSIKLLGWIKMLRLLKWVVRHNMIVSLLPRQQEILFANWGPPCRILIENVNAAWDLQTPAQELHGFSYVFLNVFILWFLDDHLYQCPGSLKWCSMAVIIPQFVSALSARSGASSALEEEPWQTPWWPTTCWCRQPRLTTSTRTGQLAARSKPPLLDLGAKPSTMKDGL